MDYLESLRAKVKKGRNVFIAPNASVHGDVEIGDECSVWFGAVIRAEHDKIRIGARSNVQDHCVLHVDPGFPVEIGEEVILGHGAIVHGATIGSNTLVGMRATVLNGAKVGKWCIIGAHSLVTEGMEIPDGSLVMGTPAKVIKQLSDAQRERVRRNAEVYVEEAGRYLGQE